MIANRGRGRMVGTSRFGDAIGYIIRDGATQKAGQEPPLAVWSANVASIETAAFEMEATASQSRAREPLYHYILSWDDGEQPTYEQAADALEIHIKALGFEGLQYVAALQNDGKSGHFHVHAVFNRVDPITHVAREVWQDRERMREACRQAEREGGWVTRDRIVEHKLSHGARDIEYFEKRRSFERIVREDIGPAIRRIFAKESPSWVDVHQLMRAQSVRYEVVYRPGARGAPAIVQGARIVGAGRGEYARARDLGPDLTHRRLEARLGAFTPDLTLEETKGFTERCRVAAEAIKQLNETSASWEQAHAVFEKHGVEYERYRTGGRLADLRGPETARPSDVARHLSFADMVKRFGPYESSSEMRKRLQSRQAVAHAESLIIGSRLIADPTPILDRLTANNATFSFREAERLVNEKIINEAQRQALLKTVVERSVQRRDARGRTRLTTQNVLDTEKKLRDAAVKLARTSIARPITRVASKRLDEQQRDAYVYAIRKSSRLKVITGVPGAGKTVLINDIANAYRQAGYTVRAVSVANSAVDVLRRETVGISTQSVAKQLAEWSRGNEKLGAQDVLIIDEVSTLGTQQGAELLAEAEKAGAVVIALGDDKQFQSVSHGSALTLMQKAVGTDSKDLAKTRRQQENWQRKATEDVRAGAVRLALEEYQKRGFVHEHSTQAEARSALIKRWVEIERSGTECGIEAFTNHERMNLNAAAREEWRNMGKLYGDDNLLETIDGSTPYATGDRVVIRQTIPGTGLFNGSVGTVTAIEGDVLWLERLTKQGDEIKKTVHSISTRDFPGIQHGYCSTEYREQGSTRFAELQLVTKHVNQRSLTVGMTRHTHEYGMFYSKEEVGSFDRLVSLGERTHSKELASEYRENKITESENPLREVSVAQILFELTDIISKKNSRFTDNHKVTARSLKRNLADFPKDQFLQISVDWRIELSGKSSIYQQIRDEQAFLNRSRDSRMLNRGLER